MDYDQQQSVLSQIAEAKQSLESLGHAVKDGQVSGAIEIAGAVAEQMASIVDAVKRPQSRRKAG